MDRSSSWTNAERNGDYIPPSRVARMAVPSPRPPPGSTVEAVATARRAEYGTGGRILPVLPSASPNASKRGSWTTSRPSSGSLEDEFHQSSNESFVPPPRRAEMASMAATRRTEPVRQSDGLFASETEQAQLAYMEQMYGTISLLNAELENERRSRAALETAAAAARPSTYPAMPGYSSYEQDVQLPVGEFDEPSTSFIVSQTPVAPSSSPRKLRTMPSPPSNPPQSQHRVARPPVSPRLIAKGQDENLCATLGKNAELRIRSRDMERTVEKAELELELARKQIKMAERRAENREEKLRVLLKEKLNWQKELKATRAQVVEEKMRQVDLFREVEAAKRHFAAELEAVEQELRETQEENIQLRTHASEMKAQMHFQAQKMDEMVRQAQDEKARFVVMIEDTRHRFREWKEGEAAALEDAHDQVVRNLKTEYELKLERHQDEKKKLRDKVNDLEVSMRLLQKDRALSPLELSLRKTAILGSKDSTGIVEAGHIERQSRILELENMLAHSQEYQSRQESIIKLSEATISRLMQEREVTALENLSLHPFGVELQRSEAFSYDTQHTGYVTAPTSPVRRMSPPGTPSRSPQNTVKSSEPPRIRSPKSRSHTPRRADLEASIAQAAAGLDSAPDQAVKTESAAPSSREQSLMVELALLRKELAEAAAKAIELPARSNVDNVEDELKPVDIPEIQEAADVPTVHDDKEAAEITEPGTQNELATALKSEHDIEETPEAEGAKYTDESLPEETPFQNADEERHSDIIVHSDVVSTDEIDAIKSSDAKETGVDESKQCEASSVKTDIYDEVNVPMALTGPSDVSEEASSAESSEPRDDCITTATGQDKVDTEEGDSNEITATVSKDTSAVVDSCSLQELQTESIDSHEVIVDHDQDDGVRSDLRGNDEVSALAGTCDEGDSPSQDVTEGVMNESSTVVTEKREECLKDVVGEPLEVLEASPETLDASAQLEDVRDMESPDGESVLVEADNPNKSPVCEPNQTAPAFENDVSNEIEGNSMSDSNIDVDKLNISDTERRKAEDGAPLQASDILAPNDAVDGMEVNSKQVVESCPNPLLENTDKPSVSPDDCVEEVRVGNEVQEGSEAEVGANSTESIELAASEVVNTKNLEGVGASGSLADNVEPTEALSSEVEEPNTPTDELLEVEETSELVVSEVEVSSQLLEALVDPPEGTRVQLNSPPAKGEVVPVSASAEMPETRVAEALVAIAECVAISLVKSLLESSDDVSEAVLDTIGIPPVEQRDDNELNPSEPNLPADPIPNELTPMIDTLTVARDFVDEVSHEALAAVLLSLQNERCSDRMQEHEEVESNSTRSIIESCEDQNEFNTDESEGEIVEDSRVVEDTTCSLSTPGDAVGEVRLADTDAGTEQSGFHDEVEDDSLVVTIARIACHCVETIESEVIAALTAVDMEGELLDDKVVAETRDVEEPTTLDANEVSTQEIVSDVASVFASQAIEVVLKRLSQSFGQQNTAEESKLSDIANGDQTRVVDENVSATEEDQSVLLLETPLVEGSFAVDGAEENGVNVDTSEQPNVAPRSTGVELTGESIDTNDNSFRLMETSMEESAVLPPDVTNKDHNTASILEPKNNEDPLPASIDESTSTLDCEHASLQEIMTSNEDPISSDITVVPTELTPDDLPVVVELLPATACDLVGSSDDISPEANGDQEASMVDTEGLSTIESVVGGIIDAIERYYQVDTDSRSGDVNDSKTRDEDADQATAVSVTMEASAVLASDMSLQGSDLTGKEPCSIQVSDEPTEVVVEATQETELLTPDAEASESLDTIIVRMEEKHGDIELYAATPFGSALEDEEVVVRSALESLVNSIANVNVVNPTPSQLDTDKPHDSKTIEVSLRNVEISGANSVMDSPNDPADADNVEKEISSLHAKDEFNSSESSLQTEVEKVVADLCASVDRKLAPKHAVHFASNSNEEKSDRLAQARRSVLLWEAPIDTACTKEAMENSAKRRASKRRTSRRPLADLLAFPTEMARFTSSDTTLLAYDARHEQGQIFSLLDQSILTINPNGQHIHLDDQDDRVESKIIGKRKTLMQELHSKNLALRQIPRFNYMPMCIKFQWSDFVVATPVRPTNGKLGEGHISRSPVEPMRLLQKKGTKLPCGSYVVVSAFIRPLEDGNENLRVQIYDAERVEEFQFDFSEDIMKKYHLESTGIEAQALEFLSHLEFRRDEDTIIIKLPEKKADEGGKADAFDRIQSERTMVTGGDPRKRELSPKQSRVSFNRQKRPASSPGVTTSQDNSEFSLSRQPEMMPATPDEPSDAHEEEGE